MHETNLSRADVEALRRFDGCVIANAIEELDIRPRNEGFAHGEFHCMFPKLPPVAGFAVTGRMRSSAQPIHGHYYYDHIEWWRHVDSFPAPRIIVLRDVDEVPGLGALFGELHARICRALDCLAYVTNGSARDLPGIERVGFQVFASRPAVSHAYAHVVDFGGPVEIGGLRIHSGDLLHGDRHGIQSIPQEAAPKLPAVAEGLLEDEQSFIGKCLDGNFSLDALAAEIRKHAETPKWK